MTARSWPRRLARLAALAIAARHVLGGRDPFVGCLTNREIDQLP